MFREKERDWNRDRKNNLGNRNSCNQQDTFG